jgi:hypothetical protein
LTLYGEKSETIGTPLAQKSLSKMTAGKIVKKNLQVVQN